MIRNERVERSGVESESESESVIRMEKRCGRCGTAQIVAGGIGWLTVASARNGGRRAEGCFFVRRGWSAAAAAVDRGCPDRSELAWPLSPSPSALSRALLAPVRRNSAREFAPGRRLACPPAGPAPPRLAARHVLPRAHRPHSESTPRARPPRPLEPFAVRPSARLSAPPQEMRALVNARTATHASARGSPGHHGRFRRPLLPHQTAFCECGDANNR